MSLRFQDLDRFSAADIEAALARNDPAELSLVPVTAALLAEEVVQAAYLCEQLARHTDPTVRGNALLSLGHLARRFGNLDEARIRPLIEAALHDPDGAVRVQAKSAADEIHQFLHWSITGHVFG